MYRQVDTSPSYRVTHQLLPAVVLWVRIKRLIGAGISFMLLWGIQRQGGLVPAWRGGRHRCLVYNINLQPLSNMCVTRSERSTSVKKCARTTKRSLNRESQESHQDTMISSTVNTKLLRAGRRACTSMFSTPTRTKKKWQAGIPP